MYPVFFFKSIESLLCFGIISIICMMCAMGASASSGKTVEIPYVDGIKINADPTDWGDNGYRIEMLGMQNASHWNRSVDDFYPTVRLGWDKRGIIVLVQVKDNAVKGSDDLPSLYMKDCVELWAGVNGKEPSSYQLAVSPGANPIAEKTLAYFWDRRIGKEPRPALTQESAFKLVPGGYIMEVLLPWKNLDISPSKGDEVGFQIVIDDCDADSQTYADCAHAFWCPVPGSTANTLGSMYSIKLSDKASTPILAAGTGEYRFSRLSQVDVRTVPGFTGKTVNLNAGKKQIGSAVIQKGDDGWGKVSIRIPMPKNNKPYPNPTLSIDDQQVGIVQLGGDPSLARAKALEAANLHPDPYVFSGTEFPKCEFLQPLLAEEIIGTYDVKCSYYDNEYNLVTSANKPGRYGSVIEAIPQNGGRSIRRFKTLFCQPTPFQWWDVNLDLNVKLPEQLGIDPVVAKEQPGPVSEMFKWSLVSDISQGGITAVVLAGLYETKPGTVITRYTDVFAKDRQWWVGLKRKIYGMDKLYPNPIICPKSVVGKPAMTIHEGTLAEAGMKPEGVQKLDELLNAWAADSDEGFATCIVRHGVVVLHKAYGTRDGKPMTVDTKSWMASNSKTLAANLMWMLIDQGFVNLDDTVDKYLPPLRGVKTSKPVTIRRIYNHTWGFMDGGHWGDDMSDLEEVLVDYFPSLKVGSEQMYNGVGYAIGGKIVEAISGESIPNAYMNHLIKPLGLTGTEVTNCSYDAQSIPMDMAEVSQMMLNGGAYGDKRFYSQETFNKMLPEDLNKYIPAGSKTTTPDRWWGVGLMNYVGEGLGKGTYGHGAASGATLRIDPVNDLIIVMTRNNVGKNYEKYHPKFIEAVVNAIDTGK